MLGSAAPLIVSLFLATSSEAQSLLETCSVFLRYRDVYPGSVRVIDEPSFPVSGLPHCIESALEIYAKRAPRFGMTQARVRFASPQKAITVFLEEDVALDARGQNSSDPFADACVLEVAIQKSPFYLASIRRKQPRCLTSLYEERIPGSYCAKTVEGCFNWAAHALTDPAVKSVGVQDVYNRGGRSIRARYTLN